MTPEERAVMEEYVRRNKAKKQSYLDSPGFNLAFPSEEAPLEEYPGPSYDNLLLPNKGLGLQTPPEYTGNWQPPSAEEEALQAPDFLPGLVAPENLAPVGMAMKAGTGLIRGLAAKGLEKSLKFIPGATEELASQAVGSALPKAAAATASPVFNKLTQAAIPDDMGAAPTGMNVEQRLLDVLKSAKVARSELSRMFHVERRQRSAKLGEILSKSTGEPTSFAARGAMKGKLVANPPAFEPIRDKLTQIEVDELVKKVHLTNKLLPFEKLSADEGLRKIFDGEIPQPSEIGMLKDVFGRDIVEQVLKLRPWKEKALDIATSLSNLPRAIMASFDASAPLRQGLIMTVSHPKIAAQAFKESWKQTFNPVRYEEWLTNLKSNPLYQLMDDSGLYIADPKRQASGLVGKEERFMTDTTVSYKWLKEKLPNVGAVIERAVNMGLAPIRASERNYVSYLDKMRTDTFTQLAGSFLKKGLIPEENMELYKALAKFVNSATGRGSMEGFQRSAQVLNTLFFSPRLIKARLDMIKYYMPGNNIPWLVRKEAIKDTAETVGAGLTFVGLMKLAGARVETDPTSSDYMKARIGNTRIDPWGGNQQFVKLFARLATNKRKTASGGVARLEDVGSNRWEELKRFFSYKIAPTPALAVEALSGKKMMGNEKFDYLPEEKLIPMVYQDAKEVFNENPNLLFMTVPMSFFGMGVQTYKPKPVF